MIPRYAHTAMAALPRTQSQWRVALGDEVEDSQGPQHRALQPEFLMPSATLPRCVVVCTGVESGANSAKMVVMGADNDIVSVLFCRTYLSYDIFAGAGLVQKTLFIIHIITWLVACTLFTELYTMIDVNIK